MQTNFKNRGWAIQPSNFKFTRWRSVLYNTFTQYISVEGLNGIQSFGCSPVTATANIPDTAPAASTTTTPDQAIETILGVDVSCAPHKTYCLSTKLRRWVYLRSKYQFKKMWRKMCQKS